MNIFRLDVARGFALFLGAFCLFNIVGGIIHSGFDANIWWIDVRFVTPIIGACVLVVAAFTLIAFAIYPRMSRGRRAVTMISVGAVAAISFFNVLWFFALMLMDRINPGVPVPLSLVVLSMLALILWTVRCDSLPNRSHRLTVASTVVACVIMGPLLQMCFFGKTDYKRPGDAIVVFGARAYADGRPSDALADRVRTACVLYHEGVGEYLVFSGGPGDGMIHETEAMRRFAVQHGVPDNAIIVDEDGLDTDATVRNTAKMFERLNIRRVIAVSHFYHLPRIKMTYHRAGFDVFTVPATEKYRLRRLPWNMAREVAAIWVYYLRPLTNV